jgi:hypothetical protein
MHEPKDIISIEDNSGDTILLASYELEKNACVVGFTYLLKPLQDVLNDLYVFDVC